MVNVLQSDKNIEDMYTFKVYNQLKDPENGKLGTYLEICTVKDSPFKETTPTHLYETLEELRKEFYNPVCSDCGKTLGAEKIYIGDIEYIDEFQHKPVKCEKCQKKQITAEEL